MQLPVSSTTSAPGATSGGAAGRAAGKRWPDGSRLRTLLLLAPAVFALHNAEESATMARWAREQLPDLLVQMRASVPPGLLPAGAQALLDGLQPPSPEQFYWAAALATVVPAILYWVAVARGRRSRWTTVAVWCQAVFLLNVFVPHLTGTLVLRRYTPGVVSALALNLPLSWLIFRAALREGVVSRRALAVFAASALAGYVGLLALLLVLGRELARMSAG